MVSSVAGLQTLQRQTVVPRHGHRDGYAAIVLDGQYREIGDQGRMRAEAGDVIVHSPFSEHWDEIGRGGAGILNVPLPTEAALGLRSGRAANLPELLYAVNTDFAAFLSLLERGLHALASDDDQVDQLAQAMASDPGIAIADWADNRRLPQRSLSRDFQRAYGVTAAHHRWRVRATGAWRTIMTSSGSLADIAQHWAFADQAHMTRSVRALTGHTPGHWRRTATLAD